jgi:predicted amidohydrolase YtcJ
LTREEALRLYTIGSAWFTFDEGRKGSIEVGKLADLVVLNGDYLTVSADQIRSLESMLTMVGGRIVYAVEPFTQPKRK